MRTFLPVGTPMPDRRRAPNGRRVAVEPLEARRLLAYTFLYNGTTAVAQGDGQSDQLTIGAEQGLLYHSVNGSPPDLNWTTPNGPARVPAGAKTAVSIDQGTGQDLVILVSRSTPGESLGGTAFNVLNGGPEDRLLVDNSADNTPGNAYDVTGNTLNGPSFGVTLSGAALGAGLALSTGTSASTVTVRSTAPGQPFELFTGGAANVNLGAGAASFTLHSRVFVTGPVDTVALTVDGSLQEAPTPETPALVANADGTSNLTGFGNATILAVTSSLSAYTVLTASGNDTLSVDLSSGNAVPAGGLTYDGGAGTNTLNINAGGRAADVSTPGVVALSGIAPINYARVAAVNVVNAADGALTPVPTTANATNGVALNQVDVGSFTDATANTQASSYSAQISWGDGSPNTAGTVVPNSTGGFDVLGSHTYAQAGTFPVVTTVTDLGNTATTTVAGVPVTVSDPGGATTQIRSTANVSRFLLVVTTTADLIGAVPAPGSLRANILAANAHPGADTIVFDIVPQAPVEDIRLDAPLPPVTEAVTIDATTQPGYQGQPIVVVDGSATTGDGLTFNVGNSTVRGLVVSGFSGAGIRLASGGGDLIQNDYIGTDASGRNAAGNGVGVLVQGGAGTTIGGTAAGAGNVISGNLTAGVFVEAPGGTEIVGNRIGTDPSGTAPVSRSGSDPLQTLQSTGIVTVNSGGNAIHGNQISGNYVGVNLAGNGAGGANIVQGNLIGTDASGARAVGNIVGVYVNGSAGNLIGGNTVSGNSSVGIEMLGAAATGNQVQGNLIGLAADGQHAVAGSNGAPAQATGVFIQGASGNTLGGAAPGAGNAISGNASAGVFILSRDGTASGNVIEGNFIGLGPAGAPGPGNLGYGVLLFNAPANVVQRTGSTANQFGRNGLGNVQVFSGPLPADTGSVSAPVVSKHAPRHPAQRPVRRHHPVGPLHRRPRGHATR